MTTQHPVREPMPRHLRREDARPGGSYRLCCCGWWHLYDSACPVGASDPLTWEEFVAGVDRP
jgi:hypothetical protein